MLKFIVVYYCLLSSILAISAHTHYLLSLIQRVFDFDYICSPLGSFSGYSDELSFHFHKTEGLNQLSNYKLKEDTTTAGYSIGLPPVVSKATTCLCSHFSTPTFHRLLYLYARAVSQTFIYCLQINCCGIETVLIISRS